MKLEYNPDAASCGEGALTKAGGCTPTPAWGLVDLTPARPSY
jgi:hypothetical protein